VHGTLNVTWSVVERPSTPLVPLKSRIELQTHIIYYIKDFSMLLLFVLKIVAAALQSCSQYRGSRGSLAPLITQALGQQRATSTTHYCIENGYWHHVSNQRTRPYFA